MPTGTSADFTKLSEAMRVGARQVVQERGLFFRKEKVNGKYPACALGAAGIACGLFKIDWETVIPDMFEDSDMVYYAIQQKLGINVGDIEVPVPEVVKDKFHLYGDRYEETAPLISVVVVLNDHAEWSIKEIADWLKGQGY